GRGGKLLPTAAGAEDEGGQDSSALGTANAWMSGAWIRAVGASIGCTGGGCALPSCVVTGSGAPTLGWPSSASIISATRAAPSPCSAARGASSSETSSRTAGGTEAPGFTRASSSGGARGPLGPSASAGYGGSPASISNSSTPSE